MKLFAGRALERENLSLLQSSVLGKHGHLRTFVLRVSKGRCCCSVKKCLLESLFGGSVPGYFAPFVHGDLMDVWVFADLSRRDFVGKGEQKEVKKKYSQTLKICHL